MRPGTRVPDRMSFGPFLLRREGSTITASSISEENDMDTVRTVDDHSGVRIGTATAAGDVLTDGGVRIGRVRAAE